MFVWGEIDGADFRQVIDAAYAEVVHWTRNIFQVPSGAAGKEFVAELTRLFYAYAEQTALESVALTAVMVLPVLLLQKPHAHSKTKEHAACLERRMVLWKKGDINGLVREGRVIQKHLKCNGSFARQDNSNLRGFTRLMLLGNTRGVSMSCQTAMEVEYWACLIRSLTLTEETKLCTTFSLTSTQNQDR